MIEKGKKASIIKWETLMLLEWLHFWNKNKSQLIQIFQDFLNIPVGAWKATRFLAGWKAWGVLLQEKFICCSRNCTKSLGEGIWGTFVAKDCYEWLPNLLRLWSQGIKGMLDLSLCRTRGRNVKNWIHFDTKIKKWQSKVCESILHRRNPIW